MTIQVIARLDELAGVDPTAAPLARLQAEALRAAADRAWDQSVPALEPHRLEDGLPLLHGRTLSIDLERIKALLLRLVALMGQQPVAQGLVPREPTDTAAILRKLIRDGRLDPLALIEHSIRQDTERLDFMAAGLGVELELLATIGQVAALPLLQSCGRRAEPLLQGLIWEAGHCPVCAAWPTLAELRGLERKRWLRCGRCGAGWTYYHQRCVFCGADDHRAQGYLAPEAERDSRQAVTCDSCHGYLKTFSTLGAIARTDLGLWDLVSLELDMAALEREYGRPEAPGFPLELTVEPAQRRSGWPRWKR